MKPPDDDRSLQQLWERRRRRDLEVAGIQEGPGYLYRPGEVLCTVEDEERLREAMVDAGGRPDVKTDERLARHDIDVRRWTFPDDVDIPELLRSLRDRGDDDWRPQVAVNTVFAGEPRYRGGPGGPPLPASRVGPAPASSPCGPERPGIGVLDTGYSIDLRALHTDLFARLRPDAGDEDHLDIDGDGLLDSEAGHGTFICGLVARVAPDLLIDPERVLDPAGWGDDVSVALGLAQQKSPVVNLSLGGYTEDDRPPLAIERALRALGREVVVVAAAGNNASDRPFWPAAFKRVIAVAAVDTSVDPPRPAKFSNFGWWVDMCAPGVELRSTFVRGASRTDPSSPVEEFSGWACWSGTSFAAPLVAAAIAGEVAASGTPARRVAAQMLAGLDTRPGAEDYGVWYDPGFDLLCHEH